MPAPSFLWFAAGLGTAAAVMRHTPEEPHELRDLAVGVPQSPQPHFLLVRRCCFSASRLLDRRSTHTPARTAIGARAMLSGTSQSGAPSMTPTVPESTPA
jgi:hypothetical protein